MSWTAPSSSASPGGDGFLPSSAVFDRVTFRDLVAYGFTRPAPGGGSVTGNGLGAAVAVFGPRSSVRNGGAPTRCLSAHAASPILYSALVCVRSCITLSAGPLSGTAHRIRSPLVSRR